MRAKKRTPLQEAIDVAETAVNCLERVEFWIKRAKRGEALDEVNEVAIATQRLMERLKKLDDE